MTSEALLAIAMLCQANGYGGASWMTHWKEVSEKQLACQKWFVACVKKEATLGNWGVALTKCVEQK